MRLYIPDQDGTLALGAVLGQALAASRGDAGGPLPLLLSGPLGSGKTTLVRGLVSTLPGADMPRSGVAVSGMPRNASSAATSLFGK